MRRLGQVVQRLGPFDVVHLAESGQARTGRRRRRPGANVGIAACDRRRYTRSASNAIGLSTKTGTSSGSCPLAARRARWWRITSVRSTANAGMSTVPPRSIVVVIAVARRLDGTGVVVAPVAVRRLDEQPVDGLGRIRRRPGRVGRPAEIAAEPDRRSARAEVQLDMSPSRGCVRPGTGAPRCRGDGALLVERERSEQLDGAPRVVLGVQRERRVVPAEPLAVGVLGLLLLEVAAIRQHDPRQLDRGGRRVDRPVETRRRRDVAGSRSGRRGRA